MQVFKVDISNIHCEDCRISIRDSLSTVFTFDEVWKQDEIDDIGKPHASIKIIDDHQVSLVVANGVLTKRLQRIILNKLEKLGFIILNHSIHLLDNEDLSTTKDLSLNWSNVLKFFGFNKSTHSNKLHLQTCTKCRSESLEKQSTNDESTTINDGDKVKPVEYRAVFSIGGMTCSACANSISDTIKQTLKGSSSTGEDLKYSVDPIKNVAVVIIPNKQLSNKLIHAIKETGYTANLVELLPVTREVKYKLTAAIGGISCAACASSITSATSDLPYLVESSINVVSKTGIFILDSKDQIKLDELKESIENCGFEFEIVELEEVNHATIKKLSRSVNLKIDGMFCEHCPETISNILNSHGDAIIIDDPITLNHPFVKFTYIPSPPILTIRSVLSEITNNSGSNFKVDIIQDVSLDEHLRRIAKQETLQITLRLILTTIIAIPTFIFGIVGMSLLPKSNNFRIWLETALWIGNVSRMTWILFILSTPIYFFAADIFHSKAIKEIKTLWKRNVPWNRRFFRFGSMNLLMSLGTSVSYFASIALLGLAATSKAESHHMAFTTSYFDSVVFLTFFLLIGRLLESFSKSKTAQAISNLGSLKPSNATLVEQSNAQFINDTIIDIKFLEIGDFIKIKPGESPPVDCIIVQGLTKFDESALTGESIPVEHDVGEQVFAGTVNKGPSTIIAKLSNIDGTSLIDQIVNTVRDGQMKRAPVERKADVLTGVFVPIITLIAILTWIIWLSLGYSGSLPLNYLNNDLGGWAVWSLEFAIAVFVIACPCGIGLAAPTALFVGAGLAAKNGILARGGGSAFQEGSKINIVCFDKTGTLTMGGDLKITNFSIINDLRMKQIALQVARDLEINSNHPLANAVKNFIDHYSDSIGVDLGSVKVPESHEIVGKGLKGDVIIGEDENDDDLWTNLQPESVILGNESLMKEFNVQFTSQHLKSLNNWKIQGKSIIIVSIKCFNFFKNDKYYPILLMGARDEIRPEAKNVIKLLKDLKIETWMISGDNYITANSIAKELQIDNVVAEVLPEEKASKIKWIKENRGSVKTTIAMVGDGINDAPALAMADVGIALASGSDLALTSSDFVLLSPNFPLITLLTLLKLSKTVFQRVYFNFGWALVYNMIGVPIAAGVIYPYKNSRLSPVWASAAMALSSISVVLSSLALKLFKRPKVVTEQIQSLHSFEAVQDEF